MADNRLELIVTVDPRAANTALASVNKGFSGLEQQAIRATAKASHGFDGMVASMAKGVFTGEALFEFAKKALETLKEFTLGAIETQDQMGKMGQKFGLTAEEVSALSHVAKLADVDTQLLGRAIGYMAMNAMNAAEGSKKQRREFAMLRVEFQNVDHTLRPTMSLLSDIADRFKAMPDGLGKTAMAAEMFGMRFGKEVIPLLNMGGDAIRAMAKEAEQFGLVVTAKTAKDAEAFMDNMKRLREVASGLAFSLSKEVLPALIEFTDQMTEWVKDGGLDKMIAQIKIFVGWLRFALGAIADLLRIVITFCLDIIVLFSKVIELTLKLSGALLIPAVKKEWKEWADSVKAAYGWAEKIGKLGNAYNSPAVMSAHKPKTESSRAPGMDLMIPNENEEANKIAHFVAEANKASAEFRRSAEESLAGPAAKEIMEVAKEIQKLTTYIDEKGVVHTVALSAEARANIEAALQAKIRLLQKETAKEIVKDYREADQKRYEADVAYYQKKLEMELNLADQVLENQKEIDRYKSDAAARDRDAALRRVDLQEASTWGINPRQELAMRLSLEDQKAQIEIRYLQQVHDEKTRLFDMETDQLIAQLTIQRNLLELLKQDVSGIDAMIAKIKGQRDEMRGQIDEQTRDDITARTEEAAIRRAQIIQDDQKRIFDSLKSQAEGVWDALTTRSQSVAYAIGNAFKTAILTAMKEIVTSQVARTLMQLFSGMKIPVGGGGFGAQQQGAGGWGGIGGMLPILGGVGGFGGGGGWGPGYGLPGAPGSWPGTPPFVPAPGVGWGGGGGYPLGGGIAPTGKGGIGGMFNLGGFGAGLKNFFGFGPQGGGAHLQQSILPGGGGGMFSSLSKLGHSNAALLGGASLAMMGLQRGGASGLAMTTAGGALIGFKFGGPIGAAIGGAIGLAAGIGRLFIKSAEQKVREKVKSTYGIDIQDKGVRQQIAETAKQKFGGNIDAAIRSQEVVDLLRLYAMSTGQKGNLPAQMTPSTLVQQGGSLYQQKTYINGTPVGPSGGLIPQGSFASGIDWVPKDMLAFIHKGERVVPAAENKPLPSAGFDHIGSDRAAAASVPTTYNFNLSPEAALQLLTKGVLSIMDRHSRATQSAAVKATKSNYNRRELTSLQLSPGTLTS